MKRWKKSFIIAGLFGIVLAVGVSVYLWTNIDSIVRSAIAKYGSQVTKTPVRASAVKIRVAAGKGSIGGLTVANPKGFSTPYAIRFGSISTKLDTGTITDDTIIIDEIRISAPEIYYEMNASGETNLGVLKKNLKGPPAAKPRKGTKEKKQDASGKKLLIRKLVIEKGKIEVRIAAQDSKPRKAVLRRLELADIGSGSGATPTEVAERLLTPILQQSAQAVAEKYLRKEVDRALQGLLGQ